VLSFMIVGVQKSGTTALSHFLDQHPQIKMAKGKEVHLFDSPSFHSSWTREQIDDFYCDYFPANSKEYCCGEATPIYIYWPEIAPQLKNYNSKLKLILVLRDPVARALSQYFMTKARGLDHLPFGWALLAEIWRLFSDKWKKGGKHASNSSSRNHSYMDRGLYDRQLRNLRSCFSDDQILIIDNGELANDHQQTLSKIFKFLGIEENVTVAAERHFDGGYEQSEYSLNSRLLRWRFKLPNRRLKRQLDEMGYNPKWPWINY
jgi:hypothetical protein